MIAEISRNVRASNPCELALEMGDLARSLRGRAQRAEVSSGASIKRDRIEIHAKYLLRAVPFHLVEPRLFLESILGSFQLVVSWS